MMVKKLLILGGQGMAGHMIYNYLKNNTDWNVLATARGGNDSSLIDLDATDLLRLEQIINTERPTHVINAIGVLINGSRENTANAIFLNSYFSHRLLEISSQQSVKVIQISTDCVFSGNEKGGYTDASVPDAPDVYGRSKALGELLCGNAVTIRTSIIGPELRTAKGEGLFHWFMKLSGKKVQGYSNVFWSGLTTLELAKVIETVIDLDHSRGLYQVTNNEKISKFDLLHLFNDLWNKNKTIESFEGKVKDKSLISSHRDISFNIPTYTQMILELKEYMSKSNIYSHYE